MRAATLIIIGGALLSLGLPLIKAEQSRDETLGRRGGSSHHRSLKNVGAAAFAFGLASLSGSTVMIIGAIDSNNNPPRTLPDERGQGAKHEPKGDTLPPSYHGPITKSGSGALVASNRLTTGYPKDGVSCAIPATSTSHKTYDTNRPYIHTFPRGYTLLFVPFYSTDYSGYHWAAYDNNNKFYSFDDGDATSGDYDYSDSDDLPAGCQDMDWKHTDTDDAALAAQPPSSARASGLFSGPASHLGSAVATAAAPAQATTPGDNMGRGINTSDAQSYIAPALGPDASPRNTTLASPMQAALSGGGRVKRQGQIKLLCKPVSAREDPPHRMSWINVFLIVLASIFITGVLVIWASLAYRFVTVKQVVLVNQTVAG